MLKGALMMKRAIVCMLALIANGADALAQTCSPSLVAVQVLGSGGPRSHPGRASSSYLLWVGGQARILVDMGGGAYLRFGQAQAKLSDLSLVAISHLHPDHVSDLPALLWLSHHVREHPLPIVGPSGSDAVPAFNTFLGRLFDEKSGAFQLLGPAMGGPQGKTGGSVRLDVSVVDVAKAEPSTVFDRQGVTVTALGIPHGDVPTLAYRVEVQGVSVVFSSDQTGTSPSFVQFAKGADVLIMHLAIAAGAVNSLHAAPVVVGRVAQQANVGRLVVSHIGLFDVDAAVAEVKKAYAGPMTVAEDLQCLPVK